MSEKKARSLYVSRPVINTDDLLSWAKEQGLKSMLAPEELHVTICYSKEAFDWGDLKKQTKKLTVPAIDPDEKNAPVRKMEMFGEQKNVLVIQIESDQLHDRWQEFCDEGASYDFSEYKPHVTISYKASDAKISDIEPYRGKIVFGAERFKEIVDKWNGDAKEIDLTESLMISEARTEMAGNIRVHLNPTAGQLAQMCDREDLRGVCDDKDVYVWPSYAGTHLHVMGALGINTKNYDRRFYAFIPNAPNEKQRVWDNRTDVGNDYFPLRNGVMIGARGYALEKMKTTSTVQRWFAPRPAPVTESVEDIEGIRFYKNPSRQQVISLMGSFGELRGTSTKSDLWVWDAHVAMMHHYAHLALGLEEWKTTDFYVQQSEPLLPRSPRIGEYWVRMANSFDMNEFKTRPCVRRIILSRNATELVEAASDPLPKKFWLVFDVPSRKPYTDEDAQRFEQQLTEIAKGELHGVRGISDTREIMTEWFLMGRNAVLFMDPAAVAELNDVERIRYDDPNYLCRNGMAAIYRLWSKEGRGGNKTEIEHQGLMHNLLDYFIQSVRKYDDYLARTMTDLITPICRRYSKNLPEINSPKDLMRFLHTEFTTGDEKYSWRSNELIERMKTFAHFPEATLDALREIGKIYEGEREWLVTSPVFYVPENSILMIGADPEVAANYDAWKAGEFDPGYENYFYVNYDRLITAIDRHDLRRHYALRFVDSKKFEYNRVDIKVRRRNK